MTCTKCGGLVIDATHDPRCVNCGRPPGWETTKQPESIEPVIVEAAEPSRKRKPMGKWSPEAREAHKERMRAIWASKRRGGGGITAVVKAAPKIAIARPVQPAQANGNVLAAIDEVIAAKQADVQTLERAKEILSGG